MRSMRVLSTAIAVATICIKPGLTSEVMEDASSLRHKLLDAMHQVKELKRSLHDKMGLEPFLARKITKPRKLDVDTPMRCDATLSGSRDGIAQEIQFSLNQANPQLLTNLFFRETQRLELYDRFLKYADQLKQANLLPNLSDIDVQELTPMPQDLIEGAPWAVPDHDSVIRRILVYTGMYSRLRKSLYAFEIMEGDFCGRIVEDFGRRGTSISEDLLRSDQIYCIAGYDFKSNLQSKVYEELWQGQHDYRAAIKAIMLRWFQGPGGNESIERAKRELRQQPLDVLQAYAMHQLRKIVAYEALFNCAQTRDQQEPLKALHLESLAINALKKDSSDDFFILGALLASYENSANKMWRQVVDSRQLSPSYHSHLHLVPADAVCKGTKRSSGEPELLIDQNSQRKKELRYKQWVALLYAKAAHVLHAHWHAMQKVSQWSEKVQSEVGKAEAMGLAVNVEDLEAKAKTVKAAVAKLKTQIFRVGVRGISDESAKLLAINIIKLESTPSLESHFFAKPHDFLINILSSGRDGVRLPKRLLPPQQDRLVSYQDNLRRYLMRQAAFLVFYQYLQNHESKQATSSNSPALKVMTVSGKGAGAVQKVVESLQKVLSEPGSPKDPNKIAELALENANLRLMTTADLRPKPAIQETRSLDELPIMQLLASEEQKGSRHKKKKKNKKPSPLARTEPSVVAKANEESVTHSDHGDTRSTASSVAAVVGGRVIEIPTSFVIDADTLMAGSSAEAVSLQKDAPANTTKDVEKNIIFEEPEDKGRSTQQEGGSLNSSKMLPASETVAELQEILVSVQPVAPESSAQQAEKVQEGEASNPEPFPKRPTDVEQLQMQLANSAAWYHHYKMHFDQQMIINSELQIQLAEVATERDFFRNNNRTLLQELLEQRQEASAKSANTKKALQEKAVLERANANLQEELEKKTSLLQKAEDELALLKQKLAVIAGLVQGFDLNVKPQ